MRPPQRCQIGRMRSGKTERGRSQSSASVRLPRGHPPVMLRPSRPDCPRRPDMSFWCIDSHSNKKTLINFFLRELVMGAEGQSGREGHTYHHNGALDWSIPLSPCSTSSLRLTFICLTRLKQGQLGLVIWIHSLHDPAFHPVASSRLDHFCRSQIKLLLPKR